MPPTLANGKICYVEMPATDIARSLGAGISDQEDMLAFSKSGQGVVYLNFCLKSAPVHGRVHFLRSSSNRLNPREPICVIHSSGCIS